MRLVHVVAIAVMSAVALAGCKSKPIKATTPPPSTQDQGGNTSGVDTNNAGAGQNLGGDAAAMAALKQIGFTIYFDYDKAEIKQDYLPIIAAHAKYLTGNAGRKVRLEGHTDERGSREYNIGLGERRAQAVRRALMLQGVGEAQITTVSYGEERPAVQGSDEAAYAKNRRVEFTYSK
jgi:peptidoglycan-associated lipoprotein